ncbi:MAG: ABC transporter ATP-binding protein [Rhodospirillales bacterium]|nr:ABC transporter ATP-binding protein [Rhodospirillales bacterium]
MTEVMVTVNGLSKSFGGITATDNVNLEILKGEIHAIIGPNGAGKTTLISQLTGGLKVDKGSIRFQNTDITNLPPYARSRLGLARSFQITSVFHDLSVLNNASLAVQAHIGHSYRFWKPAEKDPEITVPAMEALARVGLEARAHTLTRSLSHGERRQLEIAMALATKPKILFLDEPMAGMGVDESARMVEILRTLRGENTILLIEHDMDAVFALADRITVLVYGRVIASGSPEEIRADAEVRRAYLGDES